MKIDLDDEITRFVVQEYVNKICNYSNEEELNYNLHKLIHTFSVVQMAQKLIDITKPLLPQKTKQHILNTAVLHDIGRCYEFKNGKKVDIDHGKVGAKLIKKKFPDMKIEIESTLLHNKLPSPKDPKFCQPVLDYVRDADMLANLKYQVDQTDIFLAHIWKNNTKTFLAPKIDKEIFTATKERHPIVICKIKTKTLLTMWLWELCWIFNLKTKTAFQLNKKEKIFIRFKETIIKKIIPLTTKNKKRQKELIQKIQESFPDTQLS